MRRFAYSLACSALFFVASSAASSQAVVTTTLLTAAPSPSVFGQSLVLTAMVSPNTATGAVTFYDGTTILGVAPLIAGTATLTTSQVGSGNQSLSAYYAGDVADLPSNSPAIVQSVTAGHGGGFAALASYATPASANSVAVGDFNNDLHSDFVVADPLANEVSVFIGNGDGTVQAATNYPVGTSPSGVAVGDLNGDGFTDIVVANQTSNNVSVLLGNGDGTFRAAVAYAVGTGPVTVVVADFNRDGKADVASSNGGSNNVTVLLGNGDGTLQAAMNTNTGVNPVALAAGDLNGDGHVDLVVANAGSNNISVLLGIGNGSFLSALTSALGASPSSIVVADFNGDSKQDIVVTLATANAVAVLAGKGDGNLQPLVQYPAGSAPQAVTVGDFNGDGLSDLAVTGAAANTVYVLLGNGNATFQPPYSTVAAIAPVALVAGDFNGDGVTDLALAGAGSGGVGSLGLLSGGAPVLAATQGGTESAPISSAFATNLQVTVTVAGAPAAEIVVTFAVQPSSNASGLFSGSGLTATVTTGADGTATAPQFTANALSGSYQIIATAAGTSVAFNITNIATLCTYAVTPATLTYDSNGGVFTFNISPSDPSCTWGVGADSSWITLSASSGVGVGSVTATITPNTSGVPRTGNLLVAGQSYPVTEDSTVQQFADVPPSAYYFDAVNLLKNKMITAGCDPTDYCPTLDVTRAEMAIFLVRAVFGSDNFTYSPTPYFTDVPVGSFGFAWIQKMFELGITDGCGNSQFCPDTFVTRDEMAIFIIRVRFGSSTAFYYPTTPYFTDVPASYFAFAWIQALKLDAITSGCDTTLFCPTAPVTRGDMALFVMRGAFNQLLPPGLPTITSVTPATVARGTSTTLTITGVNTNFIQGTTEVIAIPGVSIGTPTVIDSSTLTVPITVSTTATPQPESVVVLTGTEEPVLPNSLVIQ